VVDDGRLVRFGVFDFDPSAPQLRKAQRPVKLRPQALNLLRIFVSRPRQLITREAIHRELWGVDGRAALIGVEYIREPSQH
jgi:DNA-binding response OmpR family regulator